MQKFVSYVKVCNLFRNNINTIEKNTEILTEANKISLEINTKETVYMPTSRHQNARLS
jgi:hypothetical protein